MSRTALCVLLWLAPLASAACKKGDAPSEQAPVPSASAAPSDEELEKADIPVKEDFEEAAQAAINADNLEDQVKSLEQEIQGDTR